MDNQTPKIKLCEHRKFYKLYDDYIHKLVQFPIELDASTTYDLNREYSMKEISYISDIIKVRVGVLNANSQEKTKYNKK